MRQEYFSSSLRMLFTHSYVEASILILKEIHIFLQLYITTWEKLYIFRQSCVQNSDSWCRIFLNM